MLAVTIAANALAERLNDAELTTLSAALTQLGDTLATIVARRQLGQ